MMRILYLCSTLLFVCLGLPFLHVVSAEEEARLWRDRSGKFEVQATLVKQTESFVELLKQDGRVVRVPLSALSPADREYLQQVAEAKEENPFAGGVPAAERAGEPTSSAADLELLTGGANPVELPMEGEDIFLDSDEPAPPLEPDVADDQAVFQRFVQPLPKLDAYAKVSEPLLLDAAQATVALSAHRVGNAVSPETFGRVWLYDPQQKKPTTVIDIDQTLRIYDHHRAADQTLAALGLDSNSERGGDLVLLSGIAAGTPRAVGRWHLPEWNKPGFAPKIEFARMLADSRAIVQVNSAVYFWDLAAGTLQYRIERLAAGAKLECSATGRYLAVPHSGGCRLVDTSQGELLGNYTFPGTLTPQVKFSPEGKRLAIAAGNQLLVWDISSSQIVFEQTTVDPHGELLGWVGDNYLLTQLSGLIDLELGMPVWKYYLGVVRKVLTMPGGIVAVDASSGSFVAGLEVPHSSVTRATRQLQGSEQRMMVLRPGSRVSLQVKAVPGVDLAEMKAALQVAVERAGWVVDDQAAVQVLATIGRGERQTLSFRTIGSSLSAPRETVNIRPFTASVTVQSGNQQLWERSSTNMVPSFLRLEAGENLQQAVKKYEKADPGYFERLVFPPKILRPEFSKAVGTSGIKNGRWADR
ncbi:MAG: hypothetical protein KDA45_11180 [Planctomycetales bacterium]|nr:hypothetical protein [Planctomycetales bacterium]